MIAFHSFWSAPNLYRNNGEVGIPDFELLTSILSVLTWQRNNGQIKMITDRKGAEYFRLMGMHGLWDEMESSLDRIGDHIDPFLFWAAGKLYALQTMDTPCVMLDTDLIIWKNVDDLLQADIVTAHPEDLNPGIYPDPETFHLRPGYQYPDEWDFSLDAANTAFMYLRDASFRDYYVEQAIRFFENVETEGLDPVTAMCFAEQRVLPMCAAAKGLRMGYLLKPEFFYKQELATHTWGFKQVLGTVPEARYEFCMRCVKRIMTDFPEGERFLRDNPVLRKYYEDYQRDR